MSRLMIAMTVALLGVAPLFAQENGEQDARGFVTGLGGFTVSAGNTSGDFRVDGGVRVAPHLMVFGNVGRFGDLQGDLQPTLDAATAALAANQGLTVLGNGSLPASYVTGGLRVEVPTNTRVLPYVLGGVGVAHLSPTAQFAFSSGTMPDGSTPAVGTNVTEALKPVAISPRNPPAQRSCSPWEAGSRFPLYLTGWPTWGIATLASPRTQR